MIHHERISKQSLGVGMLTQTILTTQGVGLKEPRTKYFKIW